MKDLYLIMIGLCLLGTVIIYCLNKTIQNMRELRNIWKEYKQKEEELQNTLKEFYKNK